MTPDTTQGLTQGLDTTPADSAADVPADLADLTADLKSIRDNIAILFPEGQIVEVRAYTKHSSGYPFTQRFTDHDAAAAKIKELSDGGNYEGVYYTLDAFPSDLKFDKPSSGVSNDQVSRRIWLFIDCDASRPSPPIEWKVDKTDSEEVKAEKKAKTAEWKWRRQCERRVKSVRNCGRQHHVVE
jgi:hypothetical protein